MWSCLGSVLYWKLSSLLCLEFFPCKKNPCSALPALLPLLPVLWLGASRGNCLCRVNGDSLHSEQEQSVPGSIPVLPCCEPDLSLLLHPPHREGLEAWEWTLASPAATSRQQQPAGSPAERGSRAFALAMPLLSFPCCSSAPSQGMDGLLALIIPAGAAKISDLVQEELVPPRHGLSSGSPLPCKPQGAAGKGREG